VGFLLLKKIIKKAVNALFINREIELNMAAAISIDDDRPVR
jgi:hypothetical protein